MIPGMTERLGREVPVEEVEDGVGAEVVVVEDEEAGLRSLIVRRRIRGRSRIRRVERIIIGDSSGRRRLLVEVACLVELGGKDFCICIASRRSDSRVISTDSVGDLYRYDKVEKYIDSLIF